MHTYRHQTIKVLLMLMGVYFIVFFLALYHQWQGIALFSIGIPTELVNITVMVLCVIGIIKTIFDIVRVEHRQAFEKRVKKAM